MLQQFICAHQQDNILQTLDIEATKLFEQNKNTPFEMSLLFNEGVSVIKSIKNRQRIRYYFDEKNVSRGTLKALISTGLKEEGNDTPSSLAL